MPELIYDLAMTGFTNFTALHYMQFLCTMHIVDFLHEDFNLTNGLILEIKTREVLICCIF